MCFICIDCVSHAPIRSVALVSRERRTVGIFALFTDSHEFYSRLYNTFGVGIRATIAVHAPYTLHPYVPVQLAAAARLFIAQIYLK